LRRCCHEVEIDAKILDLETDRHGDSSANASAGQAVGVSPMLKSLLNGSRFLVLAAVLGALAGAAALFIYGLIDTVVVIVRTIGTGEISTVGAKQLMLYFIEIFDLFLLGTVMLIMALSLYELFFDSDLKLPARLEIRTFEDLKSNLVTVVIVVMAVTFLGQIVSWGGEAELFGFGVVVALVIAALNFYLWIVKGAKK
jgi:uncharacterized membrane protein YqhA